MLLLLLLVLLLSLLLVLRINGIIIIIIIKQSLQCRAREGLQTPYDQPIEGRNN